MYGVKLAVNVEEELSNIYFISAYWTGHPEHSEGKFRLPSLISFNKTKQPHDFN